MQLCNVGARKLIQELDVCAGKIKHLSFQLNHSHKDIFFYKSCEFSTDVFQLFLEIPL